MGSSLLSQPGIGEIKGPDCDASVLVIDDDQSIRRLLSGIVERMGYHAVGAGSAREG